VGERVFLELHVGVQINLGRLSRFMTEPKSNHSEVPGTRETRDRVYEQRALEPMIQPTIVTSLTTFQGLGGHPESFKLLKLQYNLTLNSCTRHVAKAHLPECGSRWSHSGVWWLQARSGNLGPIWVR
jgi:hypothetical protein